MSVSENIYKDTRKRMRLLQRMALLAVTLKLLQRLLLQYSRKRVWIFVSSVISDHAFLELII